MFAELVVELGEKLNSYELMYNVSGHEKFDTLDDAKYFVASEYYESWSEMSDWLLEIGKHRLLFCNYKIACALSREKPIKKFVECQNNK